MAVDPLSGNLYFADGDIQTINVINPTGDFVKSLTAPPSANITRKIQAIALDVANKFVLIFELNL